MSAKNRELVQGNLFAYWATEVRALATAADPIGPESDVHLLRIMQDADVLISAWAPPAKLPPKLRNRWRKILSLSVGLTMESDDCQKV